MKRKPEDYLLLFAVLAAVAICYFMVDEAKADNDWYTACEPYHSDYSQWSACVSSQTVGPEHPCAQVHNINAQFWYACVNYYSGLVAPTGEAWQLHFYSRDTNAKLTEDALRACVACLKGRNRSRCRC